MNKLTLAVLSALGLMVLIFIIFRATRGSSGVSSENIKLSELISASIDLAERAGKKVVQIRNMDDAEIGKLSKGSTKEGKKEYVTIGDKVNGAPGEGCGTRGVRAACRGCRVGYLIRDHDEWRGRDGWSTRARARGTRYGIVRVIWGIIVATSN